MKFLLDLQALQSGSRGRGIGRYSRGLANALLRGPDGADALVLLNLAILNGQTFDEVKQWAADCGAADRIRVFQGLTRIAGMRSPDPARIHACEALYDAYVGSLGADLVHVASPFEGFGDDTVVGWTELAREGPARAVTIYDLIPFEEPEVYLANPVYGVWYRHRYAGLSKADLLLTISAHTRDVTIAMLGFPPDRVVNVGADTDAKFRKRELSPQAQISLLARYGISKPFVMHTGILERRKNVETLVRGFALLPAEVKASHQLVLVSDATETQITHMRGVARAAGLYPDSLIFPGFVPDEDLVGLYGVTRAVVMPSLAEGFGLPLLEAMRCGAPVLGADRTSLPEVVGDPAYLFNPEKPAALAEKLALLLTDAGFRARALAHCAVQERRFSWGSSSARACEAFKEAVARKRGEAESRPKERRQYVLVPPIDPKGNRLAAQTGRLIAALGETGDAILATPLAKRDDKIEEQGGSPPALEALKVSANQRLIIVGSDDGLDPYQCAVLAMTPAVVLLPEESAPVPISAEWLYRLSGYRGLFAAKNSPGGKTTLNALLGHNPTTLGVIHVSDNLASKIEQIYADHPLGAVPRLLAEIGELEAIDRLDMTCAIAANHSAAPTIPRLLVDISELVHRDAKTGIQRVVKNVLQYLLTEVRDLRVEPIYRDGDVYRYARRFTCAFLNLTTLDLKDAVVDFYASDIYFGLDLDARITPQAAESLMRLRRQGGSVNFLIHDLLPLMAPDWPGEETQTDYARWFAEETQTDFARWFPLITTVANRIIAVSQSTLDDIIAMLEKRKIQRIEPLELAWCHNGSDFNSSQTRANRLGAEDPDELVNAMFRITGRTMFLTIGTIEPRKGLSQLLDAAEEFWRDQDAAFVLVGKRGWHVEALTARIQNHPELGKRLFWFRNVGDELLEYFYRIATAVVLPSLAEGFGLPLIEAASHGTPIIARDIRVFREIGGEGVYYFSAASGGELATALRNWVDLHKKCQTPKSTSIKVLSWRESAERLLDLMLGRTPCRSWLPNKPALTSASALGNAAHPASAARRLAVRMRVTSVTPNTP